MAERRYGEASIILEDAAQAHPDQALSLLTLGQIYLAQQRWLLAEDAYNRALAREARNPLALAGLAESLLQQNRTTEALKFWQEATAIEPTLPAGFTGLGRTYLAFFNFAQAQQAFGQQQQYHPSTEAQWYLAALTAPTDLAGAVDMLKAMPAEAKPVGLQRNYLLKTLAPFNDTSPPAEIAKATGIALAQIQQWPLAIHALEIANQQKPGNADTLAFLGYAQVQAGRPALELFEQARQANPQSALPLYFQGIYLRQQGALQSAIALFNNAITLDPDNAAIYLELAETLADQGQLDLAEAGYKAALEISENDLTFQLSLARFYLSRGYKLEPAGIPLVSQMLEQDKNKVELYELLGQMQFLAGAPDGGQNSFEQALALTPDSVIARYYLARLYETNGQFSSALIEYQKVIDWDTTGIFRDRALKDIQRMQAKEK